MRRLLLLAVMALASCVEAPQDQFPEPRKLSDADRTECLAQGGRVGRGGLLPDEVCFRPHADGGKSCTKQTDCEGACILHPSSRVASCAQETPMFGCYEFLDETGKELGICVD